MPAPVSKRQMRYMHAIMNSEKGTSSRGDRVPRSVAEKYATGEKGHGKLPESKGKEHKGGVWTDKHHAKHKKKKSEVKKSFENYYFGRGAGTIVVDDTGKILIGKRSDDKLWATPGGHVEPEESFEEGALRELKEEAGLTGYMPEMIMSAKYKGNNTEQFVVKQYKGKLKGNGELTDLKFVHPDDLPWHSMRTEAIDSIKIYLTSKMKKSLRDMVAIETLSKNINRSTMGRGEAVFEVTHGDALKLVGNGTFRFLREVTRDMQDEDFKDIKIDTHILSLRRHGSDIYSGRISDGHKVIHQFANRSLPQLAAELMSVFEWYLPEDEPELDEILDAGMPDDAIFGGFNELIDNYKRHNIANIYDEMENIRSEIRNGTAVDLQQVENRIMQLFEKLESYVHDVAEKHNMLARKAGSEVDELESRLHNLQEKVEQLASKPVTVEAYSSNPQRPSSLLDGDYVYLSRPCIEISPSGKIKITFDQDWNNMDRENFLKDMRAKVVNRD
jgi:8-oxo-dGTP pyrophosphatase MutT (NUDIX family)